MREITHLVVHCSATKADMDIDVEWVRKIHKGERGWSDVGYHYFIKRDGTVQEGRPVSRRGAHVKGHNAKSIGICYAGGIDDKGRPEDNRTEAQNKALRRLLDALVIEYHGAEVLGHCDFPKVAKACPSFNTKEWYYGQTEEYETGRLAKTRGSRGSECGR